MTINKFKPLGKNEIRLLHIRHSLLPGIHFRLDQYEIDSAPQFCALSYCWGNSARNEQVFCESKYGKACLTITTSLYDILLSIKRHKFSEGLPLWIDQICINQDDNSERAHQVKLMSDIYGTAEKTLIHLGSTSTDSGQAFDILLDFISRMSPWRTKLLPMNAMSSYDSWERRVSERGDFEKLYGILQAPWFTRLWVVQEFALSRNRFIICGTKAISWEDFHTGMQYPEVRRQASRSSSRFAPPAALTNALGMLEELDSYASSSKGDQRELYELIDSFARRDASDPHDKVFALLGLAKGVERLIEAIDYDEPYWTTITRAVHLMIQQSNARWYVNRLEFLHFANPAEATNPQHGPSWIPNLVQSGAKQARLLDDEDFQHSLQQFRQSGDHLLRMRAVYLDVLEKDLGHAHANNLVRTDTHLLTSYDPEHRREWLTEFKLHIEVHQACKKGDTLYALDGLLTPCILREVGRRNGVSEFIFLGCVSSPTFMRGSGTTHFRDQDITTENFARARYGEQAITDTINEHFFRESIWEPWLRKEPRIYPFTTEDLLLV